MPKQSCRFAYGPFPVVTRQLNKGQVSGNEIFIGNGREQGDC